MHVADVLEHQLSTDPSSCPPPGLDRAYLAAVGVQNRIEAWRTAIAEELASEI